MLRSRSRWSHYYLRPGVGAKIIFLINTVHCTVSLEDARMKKTLHCDTILMLLLLLYSFKWHYMARVGAGVEAGAEIRDIGRARAENK